MASRLSPRLLPLVLACLACAPAGAAELGDAKVASYIGQQLVADIELTSVEDTSKPVQVRLASPDVYQGANVAVPPVLSSLNMNVMRRDGKQYLHVTSLNPVGADHLHLYVELVDGGRKVVRLATLWFAPDPTPTPKLALAPAPTPMPAPPKPVLAPASESTPKPAPAPVTVSAASEPVPTPIALAKPTHPKSIPLPKAQNLPACRKQESTAENACAALDSKNADLRAQIVKLEVRVQSLQAAASASLGPLARVAARPTPAAASGTTPEPTASGQLAKRPEGQPRQLPAPKGEARAPGLPWGWIVGAGAAVFALVGGWQFWRRRRQTGKGKRRDADEAVEPTLE